MLANRCRGRLKEFYGDETRTPDSALKEEDLLAAFEEGTAAAKGRLDRGYRGCRLAVANTDNQASNLFQERRSRQMSPTIFCKPVTWFTTQASSSSAIE